MPKILCRLLQWMWLPFVAVACSAPPPSPSGTAVAPASVRPDLAEPTLRLLAGSLGGSGYHDATGSVARFNSAIATAFDGAGSLYIADGPAIRKLDLASGAVSTFAGDRAQIGYVDAVGTAARFGHTHGLAYAAGTLYVLDNWCVRQIDVASATVGTVVGHCGQLARQGINGNLAAATFGNVSGMTWDGAGSLYITEPADFDVRKVDLVAGVVTTAAGVPLRRGQQDGWAPGATFSNPQGIAADGAGNVFVWDYNQLRRFDTVANTVTTLPVSGFQPGVAVSARPGSVYVVANGVGVNQIDPSSGAVLRSYSAAPLPSTPYGFSMDPAGRLFFLGNSASTVDALDLVSGVVTPLAGAAVVSAYVDGPRGTAQIQGVMPATTVDSAGNIYFGDSCALRRIDATTLAVSTLAGGPISQTNCDSADTPEGMNHVDQVQWMVADSATGSIFLSDQIGARIRRFDMASHSVTTIAGGLSSGYLDGVGTAAQFAWPAGGAVDGNGNLYVVENSNCTLRRIALRTLQVTTLAGAAGQCSDVDGVGGAARFKNPGQVVWAGNDTLFVGETQQLRRVNVATGQVDTVALAGLNPDVNLSSGLRSLAFDARFGTLWIASGSAISGYQPAGNVLWRRLGDPAVSGVTLTYWPDVTVNYPAGLSAGLYGNFYLVDEDAVLMFD